MMLGLAFVGSVVDAAGALPGVAAPCVALFNGLFGLMSLLFFAFNLLPSFFAFLTDEGPVAAVGKPLKALLTFSPLFFVMQSRCISHFFALEFAVGGAKYIPTGRGLAISHTPFHEIYATHAASCIYPGVELALLLGRMGCERVFPIPENTSDSDAWLFVATQVQQLIGAVSSREGARKSMIFSDPKSKGMLALIERVAGVEVSTLLTGESGVGKEVVATVLHKMSARARKPFIREWGSRPRGGA